MSFILYYSNYCEHCKKVIGFLSKTTTIQEDIHFICIDNRIQKNGKIYIVMQNGQEVLMAPNVTKVPALYLMSQKGQIIYGNEILNFFKPNLNKRNARAEPLAFLSCEMGEGMSDNYAYLDQTPEELSAKGNGGTRQLHRFSLLDNGNTIQTPPEDYKPDTIGQVDMGKLEQQRAAEII